MCCSRPVPLWPFVIELQETHPTRPGPGLCGQEDPQLPHIAPLPELMLGQFTDLQTPVYIVGNGHWGARSLRRDVPAEQEFWERGLAFHLEETIQPVRLHQSRAPVTILAQPHVFSWPDMLKSGLDSFLLSK